MSTRTKDPLLVTGKVLALILQAASALVGVFFILMIPLVILKSLGITTGFFDGPDAPIVFQYPLPGLALLVALALFLAACFLFFGKLRALIDTVGKGDPFTPENAQRLKMMAWLALAMQLLVMAVAWLRNYTAALTMGIADSGLGIGFGRDDIVGVMMVIVLFILARVFRHGAAMRADLEGTV